MRWSALVVSLQLATALVPRLPRLAAQPRSRRVVCDGATRCGRGPAPLLSEPADGLGAGDVVAGGGEDSSAASEWSAGSQRAMLGVAAAGLLDTGYLTTLKFFPAITGGAAWCPSGSGCADVLSSPYALLLGSVPLSLLGMCAYAGVLLLTSRASPPTAAAAADGGAATAEEVPGAVSLLALTTAMAVFSSYLVGVLSLRLHATCPFCLVSALLSWALAALAWRGGLVSGSRRAIVGGGSTLVALLGSATMAFYAESGLALREAEAIVLGGDGGPAATAMADGGRGTTVVYKAPSPTSESSSRALRVADELARRGAVMYGAHWCTHCFDQKQTLGREAWARIRYVECASDGYGAQRELCRQKDVAGYPTWEIDGVQYPGEQSIEELEILLGVAPQTPRAPAPPTARPLI